MKISKAIGMTMKFLKILSLYKDEEFTEETLDKIYEDMLKSKQNIDNSTKIYTKPVAEQAEVVANLVVEQAQPAVKPEKSKKSKNKDVDIEETIKSLEFKESKEDIESTLNVLTVPNLKKLANQLELICNSSMKKPDIVSMISEHYSYQLLKEKIADRNNAN